MSVSGRKYEKLFENVLRTKGVPYLRPRNSRRISVNGIELKTFDFLVFSSASIFVVEVKGYGRYFPDTNVAVNDVISLKTWQQKLRNYVDSIAGLFVFIYQDENFNYFMKSIDVDSFDSLKKPRAQHYHDGGTVALSHTDARNALKEVSTYLPELL